MLEVLCQVDDEVGDVVAQRFEADLAVVVDVDLADLEEAAERREHREVLRDEVAGERVEHDIDALAAGDLHDLVGEVQRARVHGVIGAHLFEQPAFLWGAGGGENLGAEVFCDLDSGHADAAGAGVDEDALALAQVCQVVERVVGREEHGRHGRRLDEADVVRFAEDHVSVHGEETAENVRPHACDLVSRTQVGHALADTHDRAREVVAEPANIDRVAGVHAERLHDVTEVDAARLDLDFDLAWTGLAPRGGVEREVGEDAGGADLQAVLR